MDNARDNTRPRSPPIVIVDFGLGNLFSVQNACTAVGLPAVISDDPHSVAQAPALILPGVGAFADAMQMIKKRDLVTPLLDFAQSGKPLMGVCLGLQLLFTESFEFGRTKGLGLITGEVVRMGSTSMRLPHIGWNRIEPGSQSAANRWANRWDGTPLQETEAGEYFYFIHSYHVVPADPSILLTSTVYELNSFCSGIRMKNVFGFQFHPERSGTAGLRVYANFKRLVYFNEFHR